MKYKKKDLLEIIDANGELIGKDDIPQNGSDLETAANNTTDYNAKIGTQPFRYDMLGRFGFTLMPFMEGKENQEQMELLNDLTNLMYDRYKEIMEFYYKNPNKLKPDYRKLSTETADPRKEINVEYAKKIIGIVQKHFENAFKEPETIDENFSIKKPLTFKSTKNDLFYITFKFDDNGRLSGVENKWDVPFPDWWGLVVPENMIIDYFKKKYPEFYLADTLNEISVVEDKLVEKKSEDEMSKKTEAEDIKDKKLQKVAGLINKLDKKDIDKLINLLERK